MDILVHQSKADFKKNLNLLPFEMGSYQKLAYRFYVENNCDIVAPIFWNSTSAKD